MQNKYVADVADFGKLGMLRYIEKTGLKVGVNWYLVKDEGNNDGKHIRYLSDDKYLGCDDELRNSLMEIIHSGERTVEHLEKLRLLKTNRYFHENLSLQKNGKIESRNEWHRRGLIALKDCDLVFLDPDNGLKPRSISPNSNKSIKYVLEEEIIDYYKAGHSVVFYSHRTRETVDQYLKRFARLFCSTEIEDSIIDGISFRRGTVRDYIFIMHKEHAALIQPCIKKFLNEKWGEHFKPIKIINMKGVSDALVEFSVQVGEMVKEACKRITKVVESEEFQLFLQGTTALRNIIELGKCNWVVILPGIDTDISDESQEKIDEYFVNYIEEDGQVYQTIKNRLLSSELLKKKRTLLSQIYNAIELKYYALAGIALSTMLEYILALETGYNRYKIAKMVEDFRGNIEEIPIDEDGVIPAFGLDGFLTNYSTDTKGFSVENEPKFVNRHCVAHGRMHRDLNKVDVYQMLCAIYALDVVIETEKSLS